MSEAAPVRRRAVKKPPVMLTKVARDLLRPASAADAERLERFRIGGEIACEVREIRNLGFHKKYWALINFLFDIWEETMPRQQWRGREVKANIDRFRDNLTILTGRFDPTYNIRGEVQLDAHSISFASMQQEEFEKLFSDTIDIALSKVLDRPDLDQAKVRQIVDQIMHFS